MLGTKMVILQLMSAGVRIVKPKPWHVLRRSHNLHFQPSGIDGDTGWLDLWSLHSRDGGSHCARAALSPIAPLNKRCWRAESHLEKLFSDSQVCFL